CLHGTTRVTCTVWLLVDQSCTGSQDLQLGGGLVLQVGDGADVLPRAVPDAVLARQTGVDRDRARAGGLVGVGDAAVGVGPAGVGGPLGGVAVAVGVAVLLGVDLELDGPGQQLPGLADVAGLQVAVV